jgi:predicted negative regulator of RcsB-dependent stress response
VDDHTPLILVELVLVFGGVLAFAWWQLRDVKRAQERSAAEKRAREAREREDG